MAKVLPFKLHYRTMSIKPLNCQSEEECRKRTRFAVSDWYEKNSVFPVLEDIQILSKGEAFVRSLFMAC